MRMRDLQPFLPYPLGRAAISTEAGNPRVRRLSLGSTARGFDATPPLRATAHGYSLQPHPMINENKGIQPASLA